MRPIWLKNKDITLVEVPGHDIQLGWIYLLENFEAVLPNAVFSGCYNGLMKDQTMEGGQKG